MRSGKSLDFVVFTGDFGLEDSDPLDAAQHVAVIFRALLVKRIFLLPGNNDLKNEDPHDIGRFQTFEKQLVVLLPDHQIEDLTTTTQTVNAIQLVGLDSATFKNANGKLREANKGEQLKELQRVEAALRPNQPSVIFTHIPNLEDPYRGDKGEVRNAWNIAPEVLSLWERIVERDDVLAVFAGHFHDARRGIYMQDFSWATNKPTLVEGRKTWISPPLAVKFQWGIKPQARGLIEASVSTDGTVSGLIKWFGYSNDDPVRDKDALLLQAQAEANHEYWKRALGFYTQAISSTDPEIHAAAENGYLKARENLHAAHVRNRIIWMTCVPVGLLILYLIIHLRGTVNRSSGRVVIETPSNLNADVPAEFFMAALVAAAQEIRALYQIEQQRSHLSLPGSGIDFSISVLSGAGHALQAIADSLPEVRGVKVGKILGAVPMIVRYLVKWRIEYGLAIHEDGTGWAHATLRWRWTTIATWVESVKVKAEESPQESIRSSVVRMLAWRIASDILSRNVVDELV